MAQTVMSEAFHKLFKDGDTPQTTPPSLGEELWRRLSANGGVVVVLGGRTTNFTEKQRRDSRFVFWDSTDPKARHHQFPSNARALLVTEFNDHVWSNRARKDAKLKKAFCPPGWISTGDIREALDYVLSQPKAATPAPVDTFVPIRNVTVAPQPTRVETVATQPASPKEETAVHNTVSVTEQVATDLRSPHKGELLAFVIANADLRADKPKEAKRLLALLQTKGVTTSEDSVKNAMWRVASALPARVNGAHAEPEHIIAAPSVAIDQKPIKKLPAADLLDGVLAEAEHALSESQKALETAQAAHDVLADAVAKMRAEVARFREQQQAIRQLARQASEFLE